ncbi:MAG: hypothetical protein ABIH99_00940 [Candidatus Micrarchaeota archaeon]
MTVQTQKIIQTHAGNVSVLPNQTWLEAIFNANKNKQTTAPNSFFNRLLLEKDLKGNFKPIPDEILKARPWFTGTAFTVGGKNKQLGERIEAECRYNGTLFTVVFNVPKDYQNTTATALLCDQGFENGTPTIQLFDSKGNPINLEETNETTIFLKFNGKIRTFQILSRDGGIMEAVGGENTLSWVSDSAAFGLSARGYYGLALYYYNLWRCVGLFYLPSDRFGVLAIESASGAGATASNDAIKTAQTALTSAQNALNTALEAVKTALNALKA